METLREKSPSIYRDQPVVVQGTLSTGFGGLEMVIVDFHEWLRAHQVPSFVVAVEGTELHRRLADRGCEGTTLVAPRQSSSSGAFKQRRLLDSPNTAHLFHSQQELKSLRFRSLEGKVSSIAHTYYGHRKRDIFHRMVFSKVDHWIALTGDQKKNLLDCTGVPEDRAEVIPNGVDLSRFQYHRKACPQLSQKIRIAVIARLDPQKGQDIAIQALYLLRSRGIDAELSFLGEDTPCEKPQTPILKEMARVMGLAKSVHFRGFQADLPATLDEFDVVWMPSYKETFGRCIIESMAFGLPVVASDAGGVPEIIRHRQNGLLFESKNANDLVNKSLELLATPEFFNHIREEARSGVERLYDIEVVWRRLLASILPGSQACREVLRSVGEAPELEVPRALSS